MTPLLYTICEIAGQVSNCSDGLFCKYCAIMTLNAHGQHFYKEGVLFRQNERLSADTRGLNLSRRSNKSLRLALALDNVAAALNYKQPMDKSFSSSGIFNLVINCFGI